MQWLNHNWVSTAKSLPPFVLGWWLGWVLAEDSWDKAPAPSLLRLLGWLLRLACLVLYFGTLLNHLVEATEEALRYEDPRWPSRG